MKNKIALWISAAFLLGCTPDEKPSAGIHTHYFDVKTYFNQEAERLKKLNPQVDKTIYLDGQAENKMLTTIDWQKELAIFADADINKASWSGSFTVDSAINYITYQSNSNKIPIKKVTIGKINNQVTSIKIIASKQNILFSTLDTLLYVPDSLYQITKHQKIQILGKKSYQVTGKIKNLFKAKN